MSDNDIVIWADVLGSRTSVDLSGAHNCSVQYNMNNPALVLPLPSISTFGVYAFGPSPCTNQALLDLHMQSHRISLTFDLTDGIGDGSNFQKLLSLSQLSLSFGVFFRWYDHTWKVTIENITVGTQPGKKDYLPGCTMTLIPNIIL